MAKEYSRSTRVADQIQRELAVAIQRKTQSDQTGLITVSKVDLSPDLKNATIYFTCLGNKSDIKQVSESLNELSGEFRHHLATQLILRSVPKIIFVYDHALEKANRLTDLIDSLHVGDDDNHD